MTKTILIDGDILIYQVVASAQEETTFDNEEFQLTCDLKVAKADFQQRLSYIQETTGYEKYLICLTCPDHNFRKDILPTYKETRKGIRKPLGFKAFRQWVEETWAGQIRCKPTLEADDVMGILSTKTPGKFAIWTDDKDLQTIPGELWLQGEKMDVTEVEAEYFHMYQTLVGDTVDNYSGCPGVGAVTAKKKLDPVTVWWPTVVAAYEAKGLTEDDALVQARCARILRAEDYDFNKKEPILWTPK